MPMLADDLAPCMRSQPKIEGGDKLAANDGAYCLSEQRTSLPGVASSTTWQRKAGKPPTRHACRPAMLTLLAAACAVDPPPEDVQHAASLLGVMGTELLAVYGRLVAERCGTGDFKAAGRDRRLWVWVRACIRHAGIMQPRIHAAPAARC
jgi:hypothetical protein